jgi:type II secretion system protein H
MRHLVRPYPARQAGFTLVEIMLVMMILAVLTGTVLTNLHAGYQDLALDSDTTLLAETIQAAQLYAKTSRHICRLEIDPARGEYYLSQATAADQPFTPVENLGDLHTVDRSIHFYDVRKLASGASDHNQLNFYPDGVADAATIILASDSGEERTIEIQALAGPPTINQNREESTWK